MQRKIYISGGGKRQNEAQKQGVVNENPVSRTVFVSQKAANAAVTKVIGVDEFRKFTEEITPEITEPITPTMSEEKVSAETAENVTEEKENSENTMMHVTEYENTDEGDDVKKTENPPNYYGYLIVDVRAASGALPISGALITISEVNGQNVTVVAVTETDNSGKTPPVKLRTKPFSDSSAPGDEKPYIAYNVETDVPGYLGVRNLGVAIYPGVTSIQNVNMIPNYGGTVEHNGNDVIYHDNEKSEMTGSEIQSGKDD